MSSSNLEIETIVRMVIDRLRDSALSIGAGANLPRPIEPAPGFAEAKYSSAEPGVLVVAEQLVTLQSLAGGLRGITTLRVPNKSIVTPAVVDELRKTGVKLERGNCSGNSNRSLNEPERAFKSARLSIVASDNKVRVVRSVNKQIEIQSVPLNNDDTQITSELSTNATSARAIWCTDRPYAAQLACNRTMGKLAAICLMQAADLNRALQQANPNVIIVDDSRWTSFQLAKLAQAWTQQIVRGGVS